MPLPDEWIVEVAFPVEDGLVAHQCSSSECGRYFKLHVDDIDDHLTCPYCGAAAPRDEFWTPAQHEHLDATIDASVTPALEEYLDDMLKRSFSGGGWSFTPGPKRPTQPPPQMLPERSVDSRLTCPECGVRFAVDGIFGQCPRCRTGNLRVYDANLVLIRRHTAADQEPHRALRHAYADGVSTFEIFCRREAVRLGLAPRGLQNLTVARDLFLSKRGVDILQPLSSQQLLVLRRLFQKRHVCEHSDGIIDEQYVRNVPEDHPLLGSRAALSIEEFDEAMHALRLVLDVLVSSRGVHQD